MPESLLCCEFDQMVYVYLDDEKKWVIIPECDIENFSNNFVVLFMGEFCL
jgi:hypothetical protein